MRKLLYLAAATMAVVPLAVPAQESFPDKPLKIVVPFAPGGASDAIARPLAQAMTGILRQPVIVENKPGAAGNIGLEFVVRSPPDGYTLLLGNLSTNAMNETSYADRLRVKPSKDLAAVGLVGLTPSVLVASMRLPVATGAELISYAKANPGKINYWLPGVASGPHFDMIQLERFSGIRMTAVPFSGGAGQGMNALIAGHVDIGVINLGGALPQIQSGKLKALAVSTSQRIPELPDVPTAAESGLGVISSSWQALFVPASTPKLIVARLHSAVNEALGRPEVKEAFARASTFVTPSKSPAEAQDWVLGETIRWAKIINDSGVRPE